jgi:cation:H+ antiporter
LQAALDGHPGIASGNVIGSNIANLALVLGITCIIFPIVVRRITLRIDWTFMMIASVLLFAFMMDGVIKWWEGAVMFSSLIVYVVWSIIRSRKEEVFSEEEEEHKPIWIYSLLIVLGCIALIFGSDWLLIGATGIAKSYNVPDNVIGATVIAFGTSVPELATSAIAAFRKETDISIGNLIGSNIFNILCILGITPMVKEIEFDKSVLSNEMVWMLLISFMILPLAIKSLKITRWKGVILVLAYLAFCYSAVSSL